MPTAVAIRHPLFMVREGQLVRPNGTRAWTRAPGAADPVRTIGSTADEKAGPYVYDVDGVEARAAQFGFFQKLEQAHAAPWIHSGCRTPEDAMDTFFAGAEAITVELRHMPEDVLEELAGLAEGEIHLAVPVGSAMPRPTELGRLANDHGLTSILLSTADPAELARAEKMAMDLRVLGASTSLLWLGPTPVPSRLEEVLEHVITWPGGAA